MNADLDDDFVLPEDKLLKIHDAWRRIADSVIPFAVSSLKVVRRFDFPLFFDIPG
jgi:hypothetical protein